MDCFDAKTETDAWNATIEEHGEGIQKIRITHSNRTRAEFLALDQEGEGMTLNRWLTNKEY